MYQLSQNDETQAFQDNKKGKVKPLKHRLLLAVLQGQPYDHLQNWLDYGHNLLIFLRLMPFWPSEMGQIWGFRAFPGKHMEITAYNFAHWYILTTYKTDKIMVMVW